MAANILVVDDSGIMRKMIRRTIGISGLDVGEVYEASNGIEGLAQLSQHEVSVVLLDINMPVMNGVQFMHRIKDDERLSKVPIVIASTEGSETRIGELKALGARGYIRKPFQPEQIRDVLEPFVGLKSEEAFAADADDDTSF
ncbi:MAG: response regulator [Planctomycetota bacterium]|nr:MAG: response regulator [Planctomycetota bacterium]